MFMESWILRVSCKVNVKPLLCMWDPKYSWFHEHSKNWIHFLSTCCLFEFMLYIPVSKFLSHVGMFFWVRVEPVQSHEGKLSCPSTQHSASGKVPTRDPSIFSLAFYHWTLTSCKSFCRVAIGVMCFFVTGPWVNWSVIVAFPGHTHLLFLYSNKVYFMWEIWSLGPSINRLVTDGNTNICCCGFI